jgi:hypothetical protein
VAEELADTRNLLARVVSFTQDAMIRAFDPTGSATSVPVESRL